MHINFLVTGGTIDVSSIKRDEIYTFNRSHILRLLTKHFDNRDGIDYSVDVLFLKDSLEMTDVDRKIILDACIKCKSDKIVITHGTDTIIQTAQYLEKHNIQKTIVLVGAFIPLIKKDLSDGEYNFGFATCAVQYEKYGVYIAMNSQVFNPNNVRKNKPINQFEKITNE